MDGQPKKNGFDYYCNRECKYFPCHPVKSPEDDFNCMFCYCPLYLMGEKCGGHYRMLEGGVKDCSACLIPHSKGGYEYINSRLKDVVFEKKTSD